MKYFIRSLFIFFMIVQLGCDRKLEILNPDERIPAQHKAVIEEDYAANAQKCIWFDDKAAAYTVAFDDARVSHYQVSGPALTERDMRGTFFIHTQYITDWTGWQWLEDHGHEIGSHTYSHPKLPELSEAQQRAEFERAIADIREHLKGITAIPSFAYPFGLYDDQVRRVMHDYHVSARGGGGLNRYDLSDDELTLVHGVGVYPPFDMASTAGWVQQAIDQRAWIMVYFHTVSALGDSDYTTIPVDRYLQHLNYVQGRRDSLWIATMGEVTSYLRLRRDATVQVKQIDSTGLEFSLANLQGSYSDLVPLTVKLVLPRNWHGLEVIATREDNVARSFRTGSDDAIFINIPFSAKILIEARKSS
jgi:peptidoglycan/xylan/chitin deacetylase (PgdA/CDA1 family)